MVQAQYMFIKLSKKNQFHNDVGENSLLKRKRVDF